MKKLESINKIGDKNLSIAARNYVNPNDVKGLALSLRQFFFPEYTYITFNDRSEQWENHIIQFRSQLQSIMVGMSMQEDEKNEVIEKIMCVFQELKEKLWKDVEAAYEGDPAAESYQEIILSYPGFYAIMVQRFAHILWENKVPLLPRMLTEYAHSATGIDIHPGAFIGESFFIDHGTGVVIGETTVIGNHVKIYQGVTLGALSTSGGQKLKSAKRHPTVEAHVTIYAGATILGGTTVIGKGAVIAGNAWVTQSVPPLTKVFPDTVEMKMRQISGEK